ncbi:MAG: HAD hydrolase-like protein [Meiothermus sp.]|nr:HAD hydrolase-like protein [Meiothermus sp.]
MSVTTLLFDLDGTLLETAPGIVGCYRHTFHQLGVGIPEGLDLLEFIGPPMQDNFRRLLDETQVETAVEIYRLCYEQKGQWQASVYEGIHQAVQTLSATYRLMVATSKRNAFAQEMTQHFGLAPYFTAIYGVQAENLSETKALLIGRILQDRGLTPAEVVMIGDRAFDIRGAKAHQMRSVGVLWGYGSREELQTHGADLLCEHPLHLPQCVASLGGPAPAYSGF